MDETTSKLRNRAAIDTWNSSFLSLLSLFSKNSKYDLCLDWIFFSGNTTRWRGTVMLSRAARWCLSFTERPAAAAAKTLRECLPMIDDYLTMIMRNAKETQVSRNLGK